MSKAEYIKERIDTLVQFWFGWAAFFGSFFFIALSLMDYIATPENFSDFIYYRFLGAFTLASAYVLNKKKLNRKYQLFFVYLGTVIPLGVIEYMILHFGGHASTYYAGFFIQYRAIIQIYYFS